MSDVLAHRVEDYEHCRQLGDFFIAEKNKHEPGCRRLNFLCPCGCGSLCGIRIRDDGERRDNCWGWNKDQDKPTCTPSIDINHGHWHGWLTNGVFTLAEPPKQPS